MTTMDELRSDPHHYMHGTSKAWRLGCRCAACARVGAGPACAPSRRFYMRWTPVEDAVAAGLHRAGWSWDEIGDALGRTPAAVKRRFFSVGSGSGRGRTASPPRPAPGR